MKLRNRMSLAIPLFICILLSCNKENPALCKPVIPPVQVTGALPCTPAGEIRFSTSPGSQYRFRLEQQTFGDVATFTGLRPGPYRVGIQQEAGCISDTVIVVPALATGPLYTAVRQLLGLHCTPCHSGVNPQAGLDFSRDCDILAHALRIEERAVQGNPSPMPQAGLLPLAERQKITDWIRAGYGAGQ